MGEKGDTFGDTRMNCPRCGHEASEDFSFCPSCGFSFDQRATMPERDYATPGNGGRSRTTIVIAIVAVSVVIIVLMSVLYVMISGFPVTDGRTPAATYSMTPVDGGWRIQVLSITKTDVPWDDVLVQVSDGSNIVDWSPKKADLDDGYMESATYTPKDMGSLTVALNVTDLSGNGYVGGSDSFTVTASPSFSPGTQYTAVLIYELTGGTMGIGVTFSG